MKQIISVGIDIGTSSTRVVVCEQRADASPTVLGFGVAETTGVRHGYIINRESVVLSLKKAIRDAEVNSGLKIKQANIAISGIGLDAQYSVGSSIVSRADGIISKLDIEKAISDAEVSLELKNKVMLHAYPVSFKIDGKEYPVRPEGIEGLKLEIRTLFVTCFQQHLDDLLGVMADANIKVLGFTATPLATQSFLLTDLQRNFGCALIDIGAETVSVSVFENNTLISLHVFDIGSLNITKDLALGLRITPEEAESIKTGVVNFQSVPKKKIDEIVEARLSDIFELVDKYLKKMGRSGLLPAGAIIIGGGSHLHNIENVAKTMLKIPVRVGHYDIPSSKGQIKDQKLLVAYALAFSSLEFGAKQNKQSSFSSGEGFIAVIKNFFKQLMP
ncbi:MAG: Cell division protein FtsA [Patescibacteria group bacterium]|jgi:cell division protein FtsA|nr:Cell division protein FtsA [Patescibacteria group bacterium]